VDRQIENHLEAQSASDSRGYLTDRPVKHVLIGGPAGPSRWSASADLHVVVARHASIAALLDLAGSQER
jgi:hypothetical protein